MNQRYFEAFGDQPEINQQKKRYHQVCKSTPSQLSEILVYFGSIYLNFAQCFYVKKSFGIRVIIFDNQFQTNVQTQQTDFDCVVQLAFVGCHFSYSEPAYIYQHIIINQQKYHLRNSLLFRQEMFLDVFDVRCR